MALCDVDDNSAKRAFEAYPKAKKYKDFRKMLDKEKGIDAVIVAIPDFMHATAAIWAMERNTSMWRNRWCAPSGKRAR